MISHTSLDIYGLSIKRLEDIGEGDLKTVQLLPGEVCKVRDMSTGEISELDSKDIWPHKHTIFIEGKEVRFLNRRTRIDDPRNPLPSSSKLQDVDQIVKSKKKKDDPRG